MSEVAPRTIKGTPFCWQSKEALRMIHEAFSETDNLPSGFAVYLALSLIASDEQSERFTARKALIAFKAGVSIRTAGDVIKRFEQMRLVQIERCSSTGTVPDGASTYTLLGVGNGCLPLSNGCAPVGNQPDQSFIADKVEESGKNGSEESHKNIISPPAEGAKVRFGATEDIEAIYQAYPRKKAPVQAKKAIGKHLAIIAQRGTPEPAAWLLGRVQAYARSRAREDQQFTPYPATWFNAGSYDEDFTAPHRGGRPRYYANPDTPRSCL